MSRLQVSYQQALVAVSHSADLADLPYLSKKAPTYTHNQFWEHGPINLDIYVFALVTERSLYYINMHYNRFIQNRYDPKLYVSCRISRNMSSRKHDKSQLEGDLWSFYNDMFLEIRDDKYSLG